MPDNHMRIEDYLSIIVIACAMCVLVCTFITVAVYRQLRSSDLVRSIAEGDAAVRDHADRQLITISETVSRIEGRQEAEDRHLLRARDLGPLHEKIHDVSVGLAEIRAQSQAESRALSEQLKVVQQILLNPRDHRGARHD